METKDWGNTAQERRLPEVPAYTPINYTKLFWTIVSAIITAAVILTLSSWLIFYVLASAFFNSLGKSTYQFKPPVSHQVPFKPSPAPVTQLNPRPPQQRQASKPSEALQHDVALCRYWSQEYQKERTERAKTLRDGYCAKFTAK